MPVDDSAENVTHRSVIKLVDGDSIEVTQETWGDWVTSTTRGPHGSDELNINQLHGSGIFKVIPMDTRNSSSCITDFLYQFQWSSHCLSNSIGG